MKSWVTSQISQEKQYSPKANWACSLTVKQGSYKSPSMVRLHPRPPKLSGRVVQRLECPPYTRKVPGSNPGAPTMEIPIIYEDGDFLIIDKPSGLLTHPVNREDKSPSVVGWVLEKYPEISTIRDNYGDSVGVWTDLRPGIVHRLDRETSGLLLIAKNQSSFNYLKNIFKERKIKKTYLALVYGIVRESSGTIDIPLGKLGSKQSTKIKGKKNLEEKSAITEFKVLQKFNDYSLIEF